MTLWRRTSREAQRDMEFVGEAMRQAAEVQTSQAVTINEMLLLLDQDIQTYGYPVEASEKPVDVS